MGVLAMDDICPKCGKQVIMFRFAEKDQWYHVVGGIPQPMSPACARPQETEAQMTDDIRARIAAILREHAYSPLLSCCRDQDDHYAHLADVVARELRPNIDAAAEALSNCVPGRPDWHEMSDGAKDWYRNAVRVTIQAAGVRADEE